MIVEIETGSVNANEIENAMPIVEATDVGPDLLTEAPGLLAVIWK